MYLRMKFTRKDGYVYESEDDNFTTLERVINSLMLFRNNYKSMILYDEHDNVVWTYGLFV